MVCILGNVSRGIIVDEVALLEALRTQQIARAGLDIYSEEPPVKPPESSAQRIMCMDNVIRLPHLTFYTAEAMQRLEEETPQRCFEILVNRPVPTKSRDPRLQN